MGIVKKMIIEKLKQNLVVIIPSYRIFLIIFIHVYIEPFNIKILEMVKASKIEKCKMKTEQQL